MTDSTFNQQAADKFSFQRLGSVFTFYGPTIKKQVITYFIVSTIFFIILLIPGHDTMRTAFFSLSWAILQYMCFLAPLSLAGKGKTGMIVRMLPTLASEKFTFYLIYFIIIIPAVLFILPVCAEISILNSPASDNPVFKSLIDFQLNSPWTAKAISITSAILSTIVCLYFVIKTRFNKMLYGILSVFACQIFLGILGGIMGGYQAMAQGFKDGYEGRPELESLEFTKEILEASPATISVVTLISACAVVFLILIYRRLKKPAL